MISTTYYYSKNYIILDIDRLPQYIQLNKKITKKTLKKMFQIILKKIIIFNKYRKILKISITSLEKTKDKNLGKILQRIFPDFLRDFSQFDKYRYCRLSSGIEKSHVDLTRGATGGEFKKSPKISPIFRYFYRFFGKFPDISYQSSPRTGYKIWLKNRGFRVREI